MPDDRWAVIICGTRWMDIKSIVETEIYAAMDQLEMWPGDIELVITGGARGVDEIGKGLTKAMGVEHREMVAEWSKHGLAAGGIRNRGMLKEIIKLQAKGLKAAVIAVWDQVSSGTLDMINVARAHGVVVEVRKFVGSFSGNYRFLSNFYPSVFWDDGLTYGTNHPTTYPTVEHYYQMQKFIKQDEVRERILRCKTPGEAKRVGREVKLSAADKVVWEKRDRLPAMRRGLVYKFPAPEGQPGRFLQHKHLFGLTDKLISTGSMPLVEGNDWHDNYWGRCVCKGCWGKVGENHLGRELEARRRQVREVCKGIVYRRSCNA